MQFLDEEEPPRPPPPPPPVIPYPPFPLLKLPREIRNSIYSYALLRPFSGPGSTPPYVCYMGHKGSCSPSTAYWGTEKSTRLFRVSRQVSAEASEIFYSSFEFHFPMSTGMALVNASLRDTLTPRARSLIRIVGFDLVLHITPGPYSQSQEERWRQVFAAVVELLPNLRIGTARVELLLDLHGTEVPECELSKVIDRAVTIASPLRGVKGLILKGRANQNAQQRRIVREWQETMGCL